MAIAKMDDPSAQSASLLGDIGLLYAKFGDQEQAVHYTRMARAKAPSDVQLMYSEAKFMFYWDNLEKRYPLTAKLSRKAIREKKFGTIPKMPNCNPSPSL
jgi:hypothetical protein